MKAKRLLGTVLAGGLGLLAVTISGDALAAKKPPAAAPAAAMSTPTSKKAIKLNPEGLAWGMSHKQVAEIIDKQLDDDFNPLFKAVSPGVKMKALDAQLAESKSQFRRSRIDFGKLPTGVDSTPLKGEYTYMNKESMLLLERGKHPKRFFFFIQDKLWKIVDEYQLVEGGALGKDFPEAIAKLSAKVFGVPGRILPADYDVGRNAVEVDWKDANTHVRAIMRGEAALALVYEDNATLGNLTSLRPNKPTVDSGIDPAVAAAVGRTAAPPERPAEAAPPEKTTKQKKQ